MSGRAPAWIAEVLHFWYDELKPKHWWSGSPAIDARIEDRFGRLNAELSASPPEPSMLDGLGHLAAVLVFDQFTRHLHRGSAAAFANDGIALAIALDGIDRGLDRSLGDPQKQFLYMPVMHSEDMAMQRRSLVLFGKLDDPGSVRSAQGHHDTIARFGRFPYRNAALGRTSTAAELAFLAEKSGP